MAGLKRPCSQLDRRTWDDDDEEEEEEAEATADDDATDGALIFR